MDRKHGNLQLLCTVRFSVYYLRVTTKWLTEMTQCACVVFVPSLRTDILPWWVLNLPYCTVTENRRPSMGGYLTYHIVPSLRTDVLPWWVLNLPYYH